MTAWLCSYYLDRRSVAKSRTAGGRGQMSFLADFDPLDSTNFVEQAGVGNNFRGNNEPLAD